MQTLRGVNRKSSFAIQLLRQGNYAEAGAILRSRIWFTESAFGLVRNLSTPFPVPEAKLPILLRPIVQDDVNKLLDTDEPGISASERYDRRTRLHLLEAGFSSCFVAATDDNRPCFVQWLISPAENALLDQAFGGLFPRLADNEVLLEGAYTSTAFRGLRIMPAAMAMLAEQAASAGAVRAITFVGEDNAPSLNGCKRAGFSPFTRRQVVHRLGYRRVTFTPIAEGWSGPEQSSS